MELTEDQLLENLRTVQSDNAIPTDTTLGVIEQTVELYLGSQDDVYIATRTLDDPDTYSPDEHVLYGERVSWFDVKDELPHHDGLSVEHAHRQLATMTLRKRNNDG